MIFIFKKYKLSYLIIFFCNSNQLCISQNKATFSIGMVSESHFRYFDELFENSGPSSIYFVTDPFTNNPNFGTNNSVRFGLKKQKWILNFDLNYSTNYIEIKNERITQSYTHISGPPPGGWINYTYHTFTDVLIKMKSVGIKTILGREIILLGSDKFVLTWRPGISAGIDMNIGNSSERCQGSTKGSSGFFNEDTSYNFPTTNNTYDLYDDFIFTKKNSFWGITSRLGYQRNQIIIDINLGVNFYTNEFFIVYFASQYRLSIYGGIGFHYVFNEGKNQIKKEKAFR